MPDALVLDVPVELGLEFMAVVRAHLADAEREPGDHGIDEVNRVCLIVSIVDFQGADARGIVDCSVLVALDGFPVFALEFQELNVNLDLVAWHLLLTSLGVDLADARAAWQPAEAMALEDTIDTRTRVVMA